MILLKKYRLSLLFIGFILTICFINPPENLPEELSVTNLDKLVHFLMFLGLSVIIFYESALRIKRKAGRRTVFGSSFLFPVVFSGSIEIAQAYLTVTRSGSWPDFLSDVAGICCGYIICRIKNSRITS
jgi:VanZ family protein